MNWNAIGAIGELVHLEGNGFGKCIGKSSKVNSEMKLKNCSETSGERYLTIRSRRPRFEFRRAKGAACHWSYVALRA